MVKLDYMIERGFTEEGGRCREGNQSTLKITKLVLDVIPGRKGIRSSGCK